MIELQPDLLLTPTQAGRLLSAWLGGAVGCRGMRRLDGGLVNTVLVLEFDREPHTAVVKLHGSGAASFAREARDLELLRASTACPAPAPYLVGDAGDLVPYAYLLLEHLPGVCLQQVSIPAAERADLERQLGAVLVELHGHLGPAYGPVGAEADVRPWGVIVASRLRGIRAHPEVARRLAPEVLERVDAAIDLAEAALQDAAPPTLIHGDVWDGNVMVRNDGGRWRISGLLDPGLEYADPEAELAYLETFDVRRDELVAAYGAARPLRSGYEVRRRFYWLHTALVHVALFGDAFFCDYTARTATAIVTGGVG